MPVVAAAVCPHPPILVPELAAGAAAETGDLRAACAEAVRFLAGAGPDRILVIGAGPTTGVRYGPGTVSTFAAYGAPGVRVDVGPLDGDPRRAGVDDDPLGGTPLSLLVGAWLLRQPEVPWTGLTVAGDADPAECRALGAQLAGDDAALALLVMGDGSARRSEHAPAHLHPRAELFDSTVAKALGAADVTVLAHLDPEIAAEVRAAGRAPWQVLAGAAAGRAWHPTLRYDAAPYGVGYFVATWSPGSTGTGSHRGAESARF